MGMEIFLGSGQPLEAADHFEVWRNGLWIGALRTLGGPLVWSYVGVLLWARRRKAWRSIPICIFWLVWKERNCLTFREGLNALGSSLL